MTYSPEQIDKIEKLASVFLPVSDIAVLIDVDPHILKADVRDYGHPARKAYVKGKTFSKAQLAAQEMKLAKIGSPLGIQSAGASLVRMELDE